MTSPAIRLRLLASATVAAFVLAGPAGGKTLAKVSTGRWVHVEIEARLGKGAPRVFRLTLTPPGGPARVFDNLPMSGDRFSELHWLGFSSTAAADTAIFIDNLKIVRVPAAPTR